MVIRIPATGIKKAPDRIVPRAAPVKSAARHPAMGWIFSPIIRVMTGNWNPQQKEKRNP